jgi:hypothetical protein
MERIELAVVLVVAAGLPGARDRFDVLADRAD